MEIPYYQVNTFTKSQFGGNPAGICPLEEWLDSEILQAIAKEKSLSETAFFVQKGNYFGLRWFTPKIELDLCGHATLASAFVIFNHLGFSKDIVHFQTQSGELVVMRQGELFAMNFPAWQATFCDKSNELLRSFPIKPTEVLRSQRDFLVVYDSQENVENLTPDLNELSKLNSIGNIVTAPGKDCDFVSRFFAPAAGIPEDPVTGSAHCTLIPYWSKRLRKKKMRALQLSRRGGELFCEDLGERVSIAGNAVTFSRGVINI